MSYTPKAAKVKAFQVTTEMTKGDIRLLPDWVWYATMYSQLEHGHFVDIYIHRRKATVGSWVTRNSRSGRIDILSDNHFKAEYNQSPEEERKC